MFRFLPWRREGLSALLRLILVVGLLEGVRSGYFAGLLPFYAPEHLGLGPAAFTLATVKEDHKIPSLFKPRIVKRTQPLEKLGSGGR